jgi:hypothetical protein
MDGERLSGCIQFQNPGLGEGVYDKKEDFVCVRNMEASFLCGVSEGSNATADDDKATPGHRLAA